MQDLVDGTANTLMFGEKHMPLKASDQPVYNGDFQSVYTRFAGHDGTQDPVTGNWTTQFYIVTNPASTLAIEASQMFSGAIHPTVAQFALCDGSVKAFRNTMALEVLHRLSQRHDGFTVSPSDF